MTSQFTSAATGLKGCDGAYPSLNLFFTPDMRPLGHLSLPLISLYNALVFSTSILFSSSAALARFVIQTLDTRDHSVVEPFNYILIRLVGTILFLSL